MSYTEGALLMMAVLLVRWWYRIIRVQEVDRAIREVLNKRIPELMAANLLASQQPWIAALRSVTKEDRHE